MTFSPIKSNQHDQGIFHAMTTRQHKMYDITLPDYILLLQSSVFGRQTWGHISVFIAMAKAIV